MAKFTTSLEVVVNNLCEDRFQPLDIRIESARPKIFDFDYLVPSKINGQDFKTYFETAFINEYLFDEFAQETVGKFKQRLHSKLLNVMPRYQTMFEVLNQIDLDDIMTNYRFTESSNGKSKALTQSGSKSASSNLPENMLATGEIGNFNNVGYASASSISRSNGESNTEDDRTLTRTGLTVNQFEILRSMNADFNDYFEQFLKEFKILFMDLLY